MSNFARLTCTCRPRPLPAAMDGSDPEPDPWGYHSRNQLDVRVYLRADLGRRWGQTLWRDGVPEIHLAVDLGRIQRRCTLAHELVHALRGAPCRPLCPVDEAAVVNLSARWLLPDLDALAGHLLDHDLIEAAERLQVTRNVLTERLDGLTEEEMAHVEHLMGGREAA